MQNGALGNNRSYGYQFAQSIDTITSYEQGASGGGYTVRAGDTLAGIAAQVWGDASLWYKLANANGLSADSALTPGQTLTLPAGVVRSTYNADQLRPYDPADAIGDVSPVSTTPAAQGRKSNKCGTFGKILLVAVAVAVTALTAGAAAAAIAPAATGGTILGGLGALAGGTLGVGATIGIGVGAGIAGSIASQGVGLATGIQDKFSWKGVALAGIAGGVGGGLAVSNILSGGTGLAGVINAAARGAVSNIATQGIALATGLQGKFDWVGVAVGAAVGGGANAGTISGLGRVGGSLVSGMAGALAGGAARSLIDGSSFGDNVLAALPDVIGSTIGNLVVAKIGGGSQSMAGSRGDSGGSGGERGSNAGGDAVVNKGGSVTAPNGDIIVTASRSGNQSSRTAAAIAAAIVNSSSGSSSAEVSDGGSNPYPVNADMTGLTFRQLQAARNEFINYAKGKGFTDYEGRLAGFAALEAQAMLREAPGIALADVNTNELLRGVLPPLDLALSLNAIGRGRATVGDYVTVGASILPGVVRAGRFAAKGVPVDIAANEAAWARAAAEAERPYSLVGANRAVIDPRKLTDYALNPLHPVGGNKARVFESAFGFNAGNADNLMLQLRQGVMETPATIGKIDQYGTRFTVDIPVTGPTGSGAVRTGWIYRPGSNTPELTTLFPK